MTLKEIITTLREPQGLSPGVVQTMRDYVVADYAQSAELLADILGLKPEAWIGFRKLTKSSAEADRQWEATEAGGKEIRLRLHLKALEKLSSTLKSRLEVMSNEARNLF